jgi:hypothetical protein
MCRADVWDEPFKRTMQPFLALGGLAPDEGEAFDLFLSDGTHKVRRTRMQGPSCGRQYPTDPSRARTFLIV